MNEPLVVTLILVAILGICPAVWAIYHCTDKRRRRKKRETEHKDEHKPGEHKPHGKH